MEKNGKVRLFDSIYLIHKCGLMLAEVRVQLDVLPGFQSIFGSVDFNDFTGLDVIEVYSVDREDGVSFEA